MPWREVDGGYTKKTKTGRGGFVRNPDQYEALRRKGYSKQRAAAITNVSKREGRLIPVRAKTRTPLYSPKHSASTAIRLGNHIKAKTVPHAMLHSKKITSALEFGTDLFKRSDMISAFGIDHGEVLSKANQKPPSAGRVALAGIAPGFHGPIAGRKGKKLRAFGNEAGGSLLGQTAGATVGMAAGKPVLASRLAAGGAVGGGIAGVYRNQRKNYLKRQS